MGRNSSHLTSAEMDALFAPGISPEDVQMYVLLRSFRNRARGEAFPGRRLLAEAICTTERTVTNRIHSLEEKGLIVCIRQRGRRTLYRFPFASGEAGCTTTTEVRFTTTIESRRPEAVKPDDRSGEGHFSLTGEEQGSAAQPKSYLAEAARQIGRWSGSTPSYSELTRLAEGVLPSAFCRAVGDLTARPRERVRSPLGLLSRLLSDEAANTDEF